MNGYRFVTVLLLLLLVGGVLGFGSSVQTPSQGVQTPSQKVHTPSLTTILTREYEFTGSEAWELVREHTDSRIEYAIEKSTTVNGFYLYLLSPEHSIQIEDSCIYLELFHPKTGETLTSFEPRITIADKTDNNIELFAFMKLEDKRYKLCVNEEDWIVSPKDRTHIVYIALDKGELKNIQFEVEVTDSEKVKNLSEGTS